MIKYKIRQQTIIQIILILSISIFSSCTNQLNTNNNINLNNLNTNLNNNKNQQHFSDINLNDYKKFNSKLEFQNFLKNNIENNQYNYIPSRLLGMEKAMIMSDSINEDSGSNTASYSNENKFNSNMEYSTTNNQIKTVDEADIVKNDGKYIYTISGNNVLIINAFPANNMEILSKIEFNNKPSNLFIFNKTLIIFENRNEHQMKVSDYDFIPYENNIQKTHINIYDISDAKNPKLLKDYSTDGIYSDARLIKNYIYLISKQYSYYRMNEDLKIPQIYEGSNKIAMPEIYYFGMPQNSFNFNIISSINLRDKNFEIKAKTLVLQSSDTLYVSENNIYLIHNKYYQPINKINRFKNSVYPLLEKNIQTKIDKIKIPENNNNFEEIQIYFTKITKILENMYLKLDKKQIQQLSKNIKNNLNNYNLKIQENRSNTIIHKIKIDNGNIEYENKVEVKGRLLNQFSLDEDKVQNLRIATTTTYWAEEGRIQYNNIYIFNSKLKQIGKLEKIAKGEKIYSTRFIGDKLYMVTYKQIDPLFVIDLSNSTKPKILGKLKIPGYSEYLHPYDNTHLIGIGKNTEETEYGNIINNGVKISLFDISDFNNPKLSADYIIKGKYTQSLISQDHKALLFSKNKNLLVVPIKQYIDNDEDNNDDIIEEDKYYHYYNSYYQNFAYIFNITKDNIELRKKITHFDKQELKNNINNYWNTQSSFIKRSIYINNTLYTISEQKIITNNLNNLEITNHLNLDYNTKSDYPEIYDDNIRVYESNSKSNLGIVESSK